MSDHRQYLKPEILDRIDSLELLARTVVEGFIAGLHKSPYRGYSVEFAQHREYVQGDEMRHVDWKVFGRTDRYYIKEYEEETNLRVWFAVDTSASMTYRGARSQWSKLDYARVMVASLAFLVFQQQDAVGLVRFADKVDFLLPSRANRGHLHAFLAKLVDVECPPKTAVAPVLEEIARTIPRRGMVVLVSDLFDDETRLLEALRLLKSHGHDVVVFHVLDPDELDLPFQDLKRFRALELLGGRKIIKLADARRVRKNYLEVVEEFIHRIKSGCLANKIDYEQAPTDTSVEVCLARYLATRARRRR